MFKRIPLLSLIIALVAMTVLFAFTGCGGDNATATPDRIVMVVIPSHEGIMANRIYGDHFSGPAGKYSLAVLPAVFPARGDPTMPPQPVRYGFIVTQLTSFDDAYPGSIIRSIVPDSAGLYDLSPPGCYMVTAGEVGELDFTTVAECWIRTE